MEECVIPMRISPRPSSAGQKQGRHSRGGNTSVIEENVSDRFQVTPRIYIKTGYRKEKKE
jgi:hypothetical protein